MKRAFTEAMEYHFGNYMAGEGIHWTPKQRAALLILELNCLSEGLEDWEFDFCNEVFPPM